jgi:hypothetical protein
VAIAGARRDAERGRSLIGSEASEVAEFHQLGFLRMLLRESVDRFVQGKQFVVFGGRRNAIWVEVGTLLPTTAFCRLMAAGLFDENAADRSAFRRRAYPPRACGVDCRRAAATLRPPACRRDSPLAGVA